jgi:pimeloyl-ACP methyl ester carboxylesterase
MRGWIEAQARGGRADAAPKYPTLEGRLQRMKEENGFLTDEQARHLTIHGISRNEDGTWSWKFDNYLNVWPADDMPQEDVTDALWRAITCPMLLLYGQNSWASNPGEGRPDRELPRMRR